MKIVFISLATFLISISSYATESSCKPTLDQQQGGPFSVVSKRAAVSEVLESIELSAKENEYIISLLSRPDTEAYSAYDSGDMGFHLLIVNKRCQTLWSGFVYHS